MLYWLQVRNKIQETIDKLFEDIPGQRVAGSAHGDYTGRNPYITQYVDLTTDQEKLIQFVKNVSIKFFPKLDAPPA